MIALLPYLLAAVVAGGFWLWDKETIASLRSEVTSLQNEVDDPVTGWRRQLAVCHQNETNFTTAINVTNTKIDDLGKLQATVAATQEQIRRTASGDAKTVADGVHTLLTAKPLSDDVCRDALVIQRQPLR